MVKGREGVVLDRLRVEFDDERAVANAGLLLPATLAGRLGLERLVNETVDLSGRPGAARPGRKVLTLCHAMLLGADSIDDCDVLRSGRTALVLGHGVLAPSTLGTFLRAFTFGHVRQLDRVLDVALERAWQAGAGPGEERLVIDIDSFVGEVHGYEKEGAAYGYTHELGYHPLLATRAGTSEVLHIRNRKGSANTQRGNPRFVDELLARVQRAGATGTILVRADTGFENKKLCVKLDRQGVLFSIGVKQHKHVREAVEKIPEEQWTPLADYPETGEAQIAEATLWGFRLVVRRVRTLGQQAQLFDTWQRFAFVTNRSEVLALVEREHREHAVVELSIRDLKAQALAHFPSGKFSANSAWCVIAALAHNLGRWASIIGLPDDRPRTAKTRRRRLFTIPGRLTRTARRWTLRLPTRWPWQTDFLAALERIRALPAPG
jgi:Transposase DDE domain group 1